MIHSEASRIGSIRGSFGRFRVRECGIFDHADTHPAAHQESRFNHVHRKTRRLVDTDANTEDEENEGTGRNDRLSFNLFRAHFGFIKILYSTIPKFSKSFPCAVFLRVPISKFEFLTFQNQILLLKSKFSIFSFLAVFCMIFGLMDDEVGPGVAGLFDLVAVVNAAPRRVSIWRSLV